jgi:hypothetical protein
MKAATRTTLVLALVCILGPAAAQTGEKQAKPAVQPSAFEAIRQHADRTVAQTSTTPALPSELVNADVKSYADHLKWQRQFARESWEWHLFSTKLLMYVVLTIVACGLWFTHLQFTKELKAEKAAPRRAVRPVAPAEPPNGSPAAPEPGQRPNTTLKAGPAGIEITSQVIGLLVLGFSLAFFYLYVKEVYPMQEAELHKQADTAPTPADPGKK